MSTFNKILTGLLAVGLISMIIFVLYREGQNTKKLNDIQTSLIEQKQLVDNITRASSSWVTQDNFEKMIKDQGLDIGAIKKDLATFNATLSGMSNLLVVSNPQNVINVPSSTTTTTDNTQTPVDPSTPDPFGYLKNTQHLTLSEQFGDNKVPIGDVAFSASKPAPWTFTLPQRTYNVTSVYGYDSTGKPLNYTKFTVTVDGKSYDAPIAENKIVTVYPSPKMSWFNPHLQFQANGGIQMQDGTVKGEFLPSIGLMLSSYGKTKSQPDLQFVGVGVGYGLNAKKPNFIFTPIQASISKYLPFTSNLYAGPYINVNTSGNMGVGLGISLNF